MMMAPWEENVGDQEGHHATAITGGIKTIFGDPVLLWLGVCELFFEASMNLFIVAWTPAVSESWNTSYVPYGVVFAAFMAAYMLGSTLPELITVASVVVPIHAVAMAAFIFTSTWYHSKAFVFLCCTVFEMCVGAYFPTHGTIRSIHLPDERRSSVMALFGFPMNGLALLVLQLDLPPRTLMALLALFQACSLTALFLFRQAVVDKDAQEAELHAFACDAPQSYGSLLCRPPTADCLLDLHDGDDEDTDDGTTAT